MIVCIAEKPSVARDIARIIGATAERQGYMEGNGYQVTWTYGHLCTLKEPHDYRPEWQHWYLTQLPMVPRRFGIKVINEQHILRQYAVVEQLFSKADGIINCGDAGQEGELIQRWVMQKARTTCPVKRLWISSMTDEAIREGFAHLKDQSEYDSLYMAGLSRAIGDWLLGMNATRLYTLKYGQNRQVLSIGRVQTPTLALIVNRDREISQFKPEPYWTLATRYRDTVFNATKGKFQSETDGQALLEAVTGKPFQVEKVEKKQGKEQPPQLYDLTALQVDCNRKLGFSAELTLNLIQQLYEQKLTTYPRVDTTYLPDDVYPKIPAICQGLQGYGRYTAWILKQEKIAKPKRVFDSSKVTDHHAIIPTGIPAVGLSDMQRQVYDMVVRRFLAVFLPDCLFATTTVTGKVEDVEFKATGKTIVNPGWRVLYPTPAPKDDGAGEASASKAQQASATSAEEGNGLLPPFEQGESGPHEPSLTQHFTQPPKHYTEATLLRAMETAGKFVEDEQLRAAMKENGIGRPSSRAGIIETLFKRHYIRREKKALVATPTGIELIGLIHEELLKSCELTGRWEKKLRDIEHHRFEASQFIDELKQQVADIVQQVMTDPTNRHVSAPT